MVRRVISSGTEARDALARGAKKLADAVSSTLGPHGQNWFLDKKNRITNDGVTVAGEIQLSDEIENRGATALREAATKTVDQVGDGTTTAITLAWAIYEAASRYLAKEGVIGKMTPSQLIKQIEKERIEVEAKLIAMATPVETEEALVHSATVSVEDKELGKLIGQTQFRLGQNGFIVAEETAERSSSVEPIKGIRIDNGFGTSQVVNNHEKGTLDIENTATLLTSFPIKDLADWNHINRVATALAKTHGITVLTVIARAWTDQTINFCLQNINNGTVKIYPLNAPYVDMQERMKDLAAVLGGTFYDVENSSLSDMSLAGVGSAKKIIGRRFDAIITGVDSDLMTFRIEKRVEELNKKLTGSVSDFEKKNLGERISQLQDGFALLKVGSPSDMERHRLYDKCEDAVNAVRAAFQEGTVPGGGLAFKMIADGLPDDYLLKRPLSSVHDQLMSMAPKEFVIEDWVRDPVKVLRIALTNACSAASAFATAAGVVTQKFPHELDEVFGKTR